MILAFAGIFVAGFLSLSSYMNVTIPCGISHGCDTVARSPASKFLGLPVAYYGFLGYLTLAALAVVRSVSVKYNPLARTLGLLISIVGTLVSFYLIYISIFDIRATCIWCIASATIMTLSFFFHGMLAQSDVPEHLHVRGDRIWIGVLALLAIGGLGMRVVDLDTMSKDSVQNLDALQNMKTEDAIPKDHPHTMGPLDAPIILVEFGDLMCSHCKDAFNHIKEIMPKTEDKVLFVFRHYPLMQLEGHGKAAEAALVSEVAAEQGKFWPFLEEIYSVEDASKIQDKDLAAMIDALGMDKGKVEDRLKNDKDPIYARVADDKDFGDKIGVHSTPTFVIGFRGQTPEAQTASHYEEALKAYLRKLEKK
jgi:protein-disulfide isomerase/uncharacterized membrane protein